MSSDIKEHIKLKATRMPAEICFPCKSTKYGGMYGYIKPKHNES